jgi:DNA mismatch repair protein MutL
MRIQQLPPSVANQIAAGEVIERPASVIKELLENSLDAKASNICVEVAYGGLNQIRISDNGIGIVAEDLPLAISAHATSKISSLDDLYSIKSMGFRGEALASIAAVAKMAISSRTATQEHAMKLDVQNCTINLTPCARNVGTTIDVIDLFFNVPVRKRFLKNEKLEFQAIERVVKCFALSAPEVAITLKHNGKEVLSLPQALNEDKKISRIAKIFGSTFMKEALIIDVALSSMSLRGWLSGPKFQRSQNDLQWVYINQRMVKDKLITHALKQTYDGLLHPGRFPACLLYFTINSNEIDVNVHPTKHEVRFQQPRLVHDFFTSQLTKALATLVNVPQETSLPTEIYESTSFPYEFAESAHSSRRSTETRPSVSGALGITSRPLEYPNLWRTSNASPHDRHSAVALNEHLNWVFLNACHVIIFINQLPFIADMTALYRSWLKEHLSQLDLPLNSRPLLVPIVYDVPSTLFQQISKLSEELTLFGINLDVTSGTKIVLRSMPIAVPYLDVSVMMDSLSHLKSIDKEQILLLLSQAQNFDPRQLSMDERLELHQFILKNYSHEVGSETFNPNKECLFKAVTEDDCRKILYE